jgi:hypothetical protein
MVCAVNAEALVASHHRGRPRSLLYDRNLESYL